MANKLMYLHNQKSHFKKSNVSSLPEKKIAANFYKNSRQFYKLPALEIVFFKPFSPIIFKIQLNMMKLEHFKKLLYVVFYFY